MGLTPDPWSFFDKIYCISIDTRSDRRTEVKKQFSAIGLHERVEFMIVKKHHDNPEKGIFESHMECLTKGLHAGANHILIFEDDVFFKRHQEKMLLDGVQFLKDNKSWDGFFLGAISNKIMKTAIKSVVKIQYTCLAHAYALNRPFAELLVKEAWDNIPYDNLLQKRGREFYALSPMIAHQGVASSDNKTVFLDKIRRLFGGLPFIQRMNELYQQNKGIIIAAHCILIAGLLLLLVKMWT